MGMGWASDNGEKSKTTSTNTMKRAVLDDEPVGFFDRKVKLPAGVFYQKYILELILRQKPLPPSKDGRHIPLRTSYDKPLVDERRGHAYISNAIRSSRYTIWDFLPKQFWFQATRLSNFYFICIGT